MTTAWRLVKTRHLSTAWDGEAAALHGGRWNSPGVRVVYVSATLSLAILEVLVHLPSGLLSALSAIRIEFDDVLVKALAPSEIPPNFQADPAPAETMRVGDVWVRSGRSGVLSVPSAIVPMERNYVLNPGHRDFAKLRFAAPETFPLDPRLVRK